MKDNLKKIGLIAIVFAAIALYFGWDTYKINYMPNVPSSLNDEFLLIPTGSNFEDMVGILKSKGFIEDETTFRKCASQQEMKNIRAGRFKIKAGTGNKALIRFLKIGEQTPSRIAYNYERTIENIAGKTARFVEPDSATIVAKFYDKAFLESKGLTTETLMSIFIPNTYEMFWNSTPEKIVEKMLKENDIFWSKNNRREKAKQLLDGKGLTEQEVYSLASIVEKESQNIEERPRIAGAYLNRLKINMKLQADPTCVFASKDFMTRRVTSYHLKFDSPYNTYLYTGLPPGPISIASASSIDAVLSPENHKYLYFCARPDNSGTHAFAETFSQHQVNVDKYIAWINARGVK